MSRVQVIRPEGVMPASSDVRVLLVLDPASPPMIGGGDGWTQANVTVDRGGMDALTIAALQRTDVVIAEVDPANAAALASFEAFAREQAGLRPVIAAVRDLTVATTRLVLRAGAADVLPLRFSATELAVAMASAASLDPVAPVSRPTKRGKIVALVGAIGGCGTTSIAVQSGIAWAATARVCLIDLDIQFGNAALYLDMRSDLTLADVLDADARLDVDLLRTIAQTHASGLNVIASPSEILPLDTLSPERIDKMLAMATQAYDVVLVDLPGAWTTWSMRVVEVADLTLMMTSLTVPGIHQARRQSEIIAANGFSERLRVVVNRVAQPMFGKVKLGETEALLGRRIDHTIANDYPTVSAAIDAGKAFGAVKSKSRVEKDVRAMVGELTTLLQAGPAA